MADTQTQHIQLHRLKGEWMAEVNRLWSAARRIQKEGLRRPRSQRTSHRRADGGADEEEGGRGQGTERDATIDGQQIIHNTPTRKRATKHKTFTPRTHQASFTSHQHANQGLPPLYRAPPSPPKRPSTTRAKFASSIAFCIPHRTCFTGFSHFHHVPVKWFGSRVSNSCALIARRLG